MPIQFRCECGKLLQARDDQAGQRVRCSACDRTLNVPDGRQGVRSADDLAAPRQSWGEIQTVGTRADFSTVGDPERPARESERRTSGLAIASLVLGVLSFCLVACSGIPGLVVGVVSLVMISKGQGRLMGKGLAIAGIVTSLIGTLIMTPAWVFGILRVRDASNRVASSGHLKQIGLAVHNYHDTYQSFPPVAVGNPPTRPGLSWRVALLPYLEQDFLFRQFRMDEPWDGPNNRLLLERMPKIYELPGARPAPPGHTYYRAFVLRGGDPGRGVPALPESPLPHHRVSIAAFTDGTSNTILVVEAADAVPWTKPDELPFAHDQPLPKLGGHFSSGFNVLLANGFVRLLKANTPETTLRGLITRNGGEVLPREP